MTISALSAVGANAQEVAPVEEAETSAVTPPVDDSVLDDATSEEDSGAEVTEDVTEASEEANDLADEPMEAAGNIVTYAAQVGESREIVSKSAIVEVTGIDRVREPFVQEDESNRTSGAPVNGPSQVVPDSIVTFTVDVALNDVDIDPDRRPDVLAKENDTMTFDLPSTLIGRAVVDMDVSLKTGAIIGKLTVTETQARLVFTEEVRKGNTTEFTIQIPAQVGRQERWSNGQVSKMDLTQTKDGQTYTYASRVWLEQYITAYENHGTSNRLWPAPLLPDEQGNATIEPYKLLHQSEIQKAGDDQEHEVKVIYRLDPETHPYAHYDVAEIRQNGWNLMVGPTRQEYTRYNTLNNDAGITATVNDEGTEVILTFKNLPAGQGANGGSIPVVLTDRAIEEKYSGDGNTFKAEMEVYLDGKLRDTPPNPRKTSANYPFSGAHASQRQRILTRYVDAITGVDLESMQQQNLLRGSDYTTQRPDVITGATEETTYYLVEEVLPTNASGVVDERPITVIYRYAQKANVLVRYENQEGTVIKEEVKLVDGRLLTSSGMTYDATSPETKPSTISFENQEYTFDKVKENSAPEQGDLQVGQIVVTYVYKVVEPTPDPEPTPNPEPTPDPEPTPTPDLKPRPNPETEKPANQPISTRVLPETGEGTSNLLFAGAVLSILMGLGLISKRKIED